MTGSSSIKWKRPEADLRGRPLGVEYCLWGGPLSSDFQLFASGLSSQFGHEPPSGASNSTQQRRRSLMLAAFLAVALLPTMRHMTH